MNSGEDYFRFLQHGHIHTLSDRIPLHWKQILLIPLSIFVILGILMGWIVGAVVGIISAVGYLLYRAASWMYYSEVQFDTKTGRLVQYKKLFNKTKSSDIITEKFDPGNLEFIDVSRSGKKKFALNYKTHKDNILLIIKGESDKSVIEKYIRERLVQTGYR